MTRATLADILAAVLIAACLFILFLVEFDLITL